MMDLPKRSTSARTLALIVACAYFIETLDATIIETSLPQIARSFATTVTQLSVGITAYMLATAVCLPAGGWLADRYGSRTVFAWAVGVFAAASVLCALSPNLGVFCLARMLQGGAGALMSPVGRLVVLRNARKDELMRAVSTIVWPAMIAPVVGPPLGGFITTIASWRWSFLINIPLGVMGFVLVLWLIPNQRSDVRRPFDRLGFVLIATALSAILYGLQLVVGARADWRLSGALLFGGALLSAAAVAHALRARFPLIDLSVVRIQTFRTGFITGGWVVRFVFSATPFLLPLLFQLCFRLNPFQSGMLLISYMGGGLAMKSMTTPILRWFGFRCVLLFNSLINATLLAGCGLLTQATPIITTVVVLFVCGLTRSMHFTAMTVMGFADTPPTLRGAATALSTMSQQVAFAIGVGLAALLLNLGRQTRHAPDFAQSDFRLAFFVLAAVALFTTVSFWRLPRHAGSEVSGHIAAT